MTEKPSGTPSLAEIERRRKAWNKQAQEAIRAGGLKPRLISYGNGQTTTVNELHPLTSNDESKTKDIED